PTSNMNQLRDTREPGARNGAAIRRATRASLSRTTPTPWRLGRAGRTVSAPLGLVASPEARHARSGSFFTRHLRHRGRHRGALDHHLLEPLGFAHALLHLGGHFDLRTT